MSSIITPSRGLWFPTVLTRPKWMDALVKPWLIGSDGKWKIGSDGKWKVSTDGDCAECCGDDPPDCYGTTCSTCSPYNWDSWTIEKLSDPITPTPNVCHICNDGEDSFEFDSNISTIELPLDVDTTLCLSQSGCRYGATEQVDASFEDQIAKLYSTGMNTDCSGSPNAGNDIREYSYVLEFSGTSTKIATLTISKYQTPCGGVGTEISLIFRQSKTIDDCSEPIVFDASENVLLDIVSSCRYYEFGSFYLLDAYTIMTGGSFKVTPCCTTAP